MILGVVSPNLFSEEFKRFVELVRDEDVVVELKFTSLTEFTQVSVIDLVDLSDYLDLLDVKALRFPLLDSASVNEFKELIEKGILIADDVDAKFLVVPCSIVEFQSLSDVIKEVYEELVEYRKVMCFEPKLSDFTTIKSITDFMEYLSEEYSPSPFALSYDLGSSRGRPILNDIFDLMSSLRIIHVCNFTKGNERAPLFRPYGEVNPYELLDFLLESRYVDHLFLHYDKKFIDMYVSDVSRIKQYIISYFERS